MPIPDRTSDQSGQAGRTRSRPPARSPSAILRRLAAAGAGNTLSRALRAVGRIERTLFVLRWLSDPALRQRSHAGLNKGEASNALRRTVFFHRQGEFRDRTFENQSFRASGLSLVTAVIVHWNTVYLNLAARRLCADGVAVPDAMLAHVAPLGWDHISLPGDYDWTAASPPPGGFRPLRDVRAPFLPLALSVQFCANRAVTPARVSNRLAAAHWFICKSRYSTCRTVSDDDMTDGALQCPSAGRAVLKPCACGAPLRGYGA